MTGVTLSNVRTLFYVIVLTLFFGLGSASAIERAGSIGVTFLPPVQLQPDLGGGDLVYGIDMSYFFAERWSGVLSWDIGLTGNKAVGVAVGPQYFFLPDARVNPYATAKFIYHLSPKNDLGWRINGGAEWNLVAATGMDNMALYGELGISQIIRANLPNLLTFELIRIGLRWSF